jgi:hypothetical protein
VSESTRQIEAAGAIILVLVVVFIVSRLVLGELIAAGERSAPRPPSGGHLIADAPSVVARKAGMIEQSRRSGLKPNPDLSPSRSSDLPSGIQKLEVSGSNSGFVVEARDKLPPGAWARLTVDRPARRVTTTCGGPPTVWCTDGRWSLEGHAVTESYLLGH